MIKLTMAGPRAANGAPITDIWVNPDHIAHMVWTGKPAEGQQPHTVLVGCRVAWEEFRVLERPEVITGLIREWRLDGTREVVYTTQ